MRWVKTFRWPQIAQPLLKGIIFPSHRVFALNLVEWTLKFFECICFEGGANFFFFLLSLLAWSILCSILMQKMMTQHILCHATFLQWEVIDPPMSIYQLWSIIMKMSDIQLQSNSVITNSMGQRISVHYSRDVAIPVKIM